MLNFPIDSEDKSWGYMSDVKEFVNASNMDEFLKALPKAMARRTEHLK